MSIVLQSSGGGSVTVQEPSTASNVTQTLQAATGTIALTNQLLGFKNRVINGQMQIDQRNAGASVTPSNNQYLVDRWKASLSASSKYSVQQNAGSVTPPTGFKNYLGVTSLSAYTVGTNESFYLQQPIEGFNTSDLDFGTANAKTITLSFWVRSSLTGTFGGSIWNSAVDRLYPFTYTISAANTWEQKSITITGDTTGTWIGATNGIGLYLNILLGAGSGVSGTANAWGTGTSYFPTGATSVVGTNGATFYITGVQLEVGSTATSFDYRPYGTELALCQRYYERLVGGSDCYDLISGAYQTGNNWAYWQYKVTKRAAATVTPSGFSNATPTAYSVTTHGVALYSATAFFLGTGSITASIEL